MSIYSKPIAFAVLSAVVILVGTVLMAFVPLFMPSTQPVSDYIKPYSPIEVEGRDIYIREGCNNCHTQTVRPLKTEVARYGDYSKPEEFAYDRPHLWGSRRTGPDLARVGGKYPDSWHYYHMDDPQGMFDKSNMPRYKWLADAALSTKYTFRKTSVLGYGMTEQQVKQQLDDYRSLVTSGSYAAKSARDAVVPSELRGQLTELDALVAYMQKLGRDLKDQQERAEARDRETYRLAQEKLAQDAADEAVR